MTQNEKNINQPDDFRHIGKHLPYAVPTGFFDEFPAKTLELAKQKSRSAHKIRLWIGGVAASVLLVALLGFLVTENNRKVMVAELKKTDVQVNNEQAQPLLTVVSEPIDLKDKQLIGLSDAGTDESLSDVLTELTDEELSQLDAIFKVDPFMDEGAQLN